MPGMPTKKVSEPSSADAASRRGDTSMTKDPLDVLRKNAYICTNEIHSDLHVVLDFIVPDWHCECIVLFAICASPAFQNSRT